MASAVAVCRGEHKPSFKYVGRDMSWYDMDGSWWYTFKCRICDKKQYMAGWYFWGTDPEEEAA